LISWQGSWKNAQDKYEGCGNVNRLHKKDNWKAFFFAMKERFIESFLKEKHLNTLHNQVYSGLSY
jgi:hypothetical protein